MAYNEMMSSKSPSRPYRKQKRAQFGGGNTPTDHGGRGRAPWNGGTSEHNGDRRRQARRRESDDRVQPLSDRGRTVHRVLHALGDR